MEPAVGFSSPIKVSARVDLPQPLSPNHRQNLCLLQSKADIIDRMHKLPRPAQESIGFDWKSLRRC